MKLKLVRENLHRCALSINVCNSGNEFVGEIFIFNFGIPKKKNVFNSQILTNQGHVPERFKFV